MDFNYLKKPDMEDHVMANEEEKIEQPEEEEKKVDDTEMIDLMHQSGIPTTNGDDKTGSKNEAPPLSSQTVIKCTPEPYIIC